MVRLIKSLETPAVEHHELITQVQSLAKQKSHYGQEPITKTRMPPDQHFYKFHCCYCRFLEMMEARKAYGSPAPSNGQSPSSGSQSPVVLPGAASPSNSSPSTPQAPVPLQTQSAPPPPPSIPHPPVQITAAHAPQTPSQTLEPSPAAMVPASTQPAPPQAQKRGFMSRLFGSSAAETSPGQYKTSVESVFIASYVSTLKDLTFKNEAFM